MELAATQQLVRIRWGAVVLGALSATLSWQLAHYTPLSKTGTAHRAAAIPVPTPDLSPLAPRLDGLFQVAAEPDGAPLMVPGNLRCGRTEMGMETTESTGRYAVQGPPDTADVHLARPTPGQGFPTARGGLHGFGPPQTPAGSAGPTAVWGRDSTLGTDQTHARGKMWGEEPSDDSGENGFGRMGEAGSVVKRFDVAPLLENQTAELRVVHTGLQVTGTRKASEVGRVMATHFAEFRACGQAALGDKAGEQRNVALAFEVLASGQTTALQATGAGASNSALGQCLEQAVSRIAFAPSDAAESTRVVYPLHFAPAGSGLNNRGVPSPVVRERCDCGG